MTMLRSEAVDYEKAREEQMRKNKERLLELKLPTAAAKVGQKKPASTRKATQRGVKRQKKQEPVVARRSMRVRGMTPSGEMVASESAGGKITVENGAGGFVRYTPSEPAKPTRKTGPVNFESVYEDDEDEATMLELLRGKSGGTTSSSSTSAADLSDLSLAEDRCVKVTKSGAVHVGVLPREDAVVVAAGDKDGRIGLWSIDRTTGAQVNVQVQPHTSYCSGLRWCGESAADLFTCSYDGTCRRLDVSEGVFHEVFSSEDHEFSAFDVCAGGSTVFLATNEGDFMVKDSRAKDLAVKPFEMSHRKINTVHIEPASGNFFTTSSTGGDVGVWDLRKLPKAVCHYPHLKSCQGSYFAPDGSQRVLTTCYDNHLSVWDFKQHKAAAVRISHNTQTGRWVLPFRAIWTPSGDGVVCGTMKRQVSVYAAKDGKRLSTCDSEFLTAIPSRFFVHPTLPLLGAATSSGRIALFES